MRSKPASSCFGYLFAYAFVGLAFFTTTASTATAGPLLGLIDASVVEVPFDPGAIVAPGSTPTLDVGRGLDIEEMYLLYGAGGGGWDHPTPTRIDPAEVLRIDESVPPTPGNEHVVYH